MDAILKSVTAEQVRDDVPEFGSGDTVRVHVRVVEGEKERVQIFEGGGLPRRGAYPTHPRKRGGPQSGGHRDRAARLLAELEEEIPNVRSVMLAALKNVRPTHLLDREVAEAWSRAAGEFAPRR